jgi:hypothetical protein
MRLKPLLHGLRLNAAPPAYSLSPLPILRSLRIKSCTDLRRARLRETDHRSNKKNSIFWLGNPSIFQVNSALLRGHKAYINGCRDSLYLLKRNRDLAASGSSQLATFFTPTLQLTSRAFTSRPQKVLLYDEIHLHNTEFRSVATFQPNIIRVI